MGLCGGKPANPEELKKNEIINETIKEDKKSQDKEFKLLLLGAGESGKSTIAKQMKVLHLNGFSKEEKQMYTIAIHQNVLGAVRALVQASARLSLPLIDPGCIATAKKFEDGSLFGSKISPAFAQEISSFWKNDVVQALFTRRNEFQLIDSASYWLEDVERIAKDDYVPSEQDVLRARIQTTGIVEIQFDVKNSKFILVDVGGQRSERKKWIHCFENVSAILFCAGISEFDQVLYEDNRTNRIHEALNLFKEICLSKWFQRSAIVLFLNKADILKTKLEAGKSIKVAFPDYSGGNGFEEVTDFLKKTFSHVVDPATQKPREVFAHITTATDTSNVKRVFEAVELTITNQSLQMAGII